jgi:hypothetical protein
MLFPVCTSNLSHLGSFVSLFCVAHVYSGPDLESSANFIKGWLFTTYPGKQPRPSEITNDRACILITFFLSPVFQRAALKELAPENPWLWIRQTQIRTLDKLCNLYITFLNFHFFIWETQIVTTTLNRFLHVRITCGIWSNLIEGLD